MDKTFAHLELGEESEKRIRKAIREADLTALREDPYYAMPEEPGLADIGEPGMAQVTDIGDLLKEDEADRAAVAATIAAVGPAGRITPILRILPLVAAAAILLMIAVPRLLPVSTGAPEQGTVIDHTESGDAYMEGSTTPTAEAPMIVGKTLTAETAAEALQAFYGEDCLVEVASEDGEEVVLSIAKEGEEELTALISLKDGAVVVRTAGGETVSEGSIGSDGTYTEKE